MYVILKLTPCFILSTKHFSISLADIGSFLLFVLGGDDAVGDGLTAV